MTIDIKSQRVSGINSVTLTPATNQNNYALGIDGSAGHESLVTISPTATIKITGIDTTGWDVGKRFTIRNGTVGSASTATCIVIEADSASSSAANRISRRRSFSKKSSLPLILGPGVEMEFIFDGTNIRTLPRDRRYMGMWDAALTPNQLDIQLSAFQSSGTGSGISTQVTYTDVDTEVVEIYSPTTGTTTTGRSAIGMGWETGRYGSGLSILRFSAVAVSQLSNATDEFDTYQGGCFTPGANPPASGWGFLYDRNSSVNWQAFTRTAGTTTLVDTGQTVVALKEIQCASFINGNGTRVDFMYSVDYGDTWTIMAPITTNIPAAVGVAGLDGIFKSAGTTACTLCFAASGRAVFAN